MTRVEKETLDEIIKRIDDKLEIIIQQTTKHNSRLSKLELWRSFLLGAWGVVSLILMSILLPILQK